MTHACSSHERASWCRGALRRALLVACALLVPLAGHCVQVVDAGDGATLYLKLSKRDITRIALDHGRIAALRYRAGDLVVEQDDEAGQLFVSVPEGSDKPVNAFLTTVGGHTFTLLLQPVDVPADSIVIRQPARAGRNTPAERSEPHVRAQRTLLLALAGDEIPRGADLREVATPTLLWQETAMTLQRMLVTETLVGERYLVTNQGSVPLTLEEREFYRPGVNAIGIDRHALGPADSTALYVIRERNSDD